jgi:hypothetical protein
MWTDGGGSADENDGNKDRDKDKDAGHGDHLQAGRFLVDVARKKAPLAIAAPGMH